MPGRGKNWFQTFLAPAHSWWKSRTERYRERGAFGKDRISGFAIQVILFLTMITIATNLYDYVYYPAARPQTVLYLTEDLGISIIWYILYLLHHQGYPRFASTLALILLIAFVTAGYDYQDLSKIMVIYSIPILMSSFILAPESSFLMAIASSLAVVMQWYASGSKGEVSGVNISVFFGLAALAWAASDQFNRIIARLHWDESRLRGSVALYQMQDNPLQDLSRQTLEICIRLTQSEIGYLAFLNKDETVLTLHAYSEHAMELCRIPNKMLETPLEQTGLWGEAVRQRRPVITNDYSAPNPFKRGLPHGHVALRRHLNAPIFDGSHIVAVVGVANKTAPYEKDDANQLILLVSQLWTMLQRSEMVERLEQSNRELAEAYEATLNGWAQALEIRNKETQEHTRRVTRLALLLARAAGLGEAELEAFRWGVMLHDIGKISVPDAILQKCGPLTEAEWMVMRQHPAIALELLAPIQYLKRSLDVPYAHHERYDGSGYPRGLRGEEIPLQARIFAIVDVWDALTSDRPYRSAWSKEQAAAYLRDQSGKGFDPQITRLFLDEILPSLERPEETAPPPEQGIFKPSYAALERRE